MLGKKIVAILIVVVMVMASLAACGGGGDDSKKTNEGDGGANTPENEGASTVSIGLVTDVGGVNDQSFNQSAWEGLKKYGDETGSKVDYIESKNEGDYTVNIETFIDQKRSLIWGVGFMLGDAIAEGGKNNPNTQFAIIDNAYDAAQVPNNNVTGVTFAAQECSFLVGYIAGKMTKTGTVGHINGIASPTMESFAVGYYAGVLYANKDTKILGQYSGAFDKPEAGKSIANQYYAEGADIIYSAAGGTGNGAIEAAKEQKKWAIGVDMDQNALAPENVLTSALKRVDVAIYDVSKKFADGSLKGGETLVYDLKNDGVGFATTGNHIPAEIISEVEEVKSKIISGEIKVPANAKEIEAQYPGKYKMPPADASSR